MGPSHKDIGIGSVSMESTNFTNGLGYTPLDYSLNQLLIDFKASTLDIGTAIKIALSVTKMDLKKFIVSFSRRRISIT